MWEFLGALFGGAYTAVKAGLEKERSREIDRKTEDWIAIKERWWKTVEDLSLERKINVYLENGYYDDAEAYALNILRSLPGMALANFHYKKHKNESRMAIRDLILCVIMAEQYGKLPSSFSGSFDNCLAFAFDFEPTKRTWVEFGRWVENALKKHGVENAELVSNFDDGGGIGWRHGGFESNRKGRHIFDVPESYAEGYMRWADTEIAELRNSFLISKKISYGENSDLQDWHNSVIDPELEKQILSKLESGDCEEERQYVLSVIRSLPGLSDAWFMVSLRGNTSPRYNALRLALYVVMAGMYGKLPLSETLQLDTHLSFAIDSWVPKEAWVAFAKWTEESLRKHGVDADMYYLGLSTPAFAWGPFAKRYKNAISIHDSTVADMINSADLKTVEKTNLAVAEHNRLYPKIRQNNRVI